MSQPNFGYLTPTTLSLFTDLYELRMMQAYDGQDHDALSTFSLFFRDLPPNRGYMITAGLEQVIHYIETLEFGERALEYLKTQDFDDDFLDRIADFEFSGEVRALPEGTPVFANEPMLEVTAPLFEAQLFETAVINQIGYQTLIATKASRMREVIDRQGDDQSLVDFGSRRAHGTDAGLKAARAAYVGGFDGTSNVAAGEAFGVPTFGTMAHSWVQSFEHERDAFEVFLDEYGEESVLLIDTYDTVEGAKLTRDVIESRDDVDEIEGVRLDSGDLTALSKAVDDVIPEIDQFISSGMDEYAIQEFLERDGVGTGFGPGTALVTSTDAPKIEGVYKLVAVEREGELRPTMKLSKGKVTYPGQKSVRRTIRAGEFAGDVVGMRDEDLPGEEQLVTVIEGGERIIDLPGLDEIQATARENRRRLPEGVRDISEPDDYEVQISDGVTQTTDQLQDSLEAQLETRRHE